MHQKNLKKNIYTNITTRKNYWPRVRDSRYEKNEKYRLRVSGNIDNNKKLK